MEMRGVLFCERIMGGLLSITIELILLYCIFKEFSTVKSRFKNIYYLIESSDRVLLLDRKIILYSEDFYERKSNQGFEGCAIEDTGGM